MLLLTLYFFDAYHAGTKRHVMAFEMKQIHKTHTVWEIGAVLKRLSHDWPGIPTDYVAALGLRVANKVWHDVSLGAAISIVVTTFARHKMTTYEKLLRSHSHTRETAIKATSKELKKHLAIWKIGPPCETPDELEDYVTFFDTKIENLAETPTIHDLMQQTEDLPERKHKQQNRREGMSDQTIDEKEMSLEEDGSYDDKANQRLYFRVPEDFYDEFHKTAERHGLTPDELFHAVVENFRHHRSTALE